jgi:hypothetical protein
MMNDIDKKAKGEDGEKKFSELCNQLDCEYLHITQGRVGFSSKMWSTEQKRPDFLVNITDVAPLFVDVKVRKKNFVGLSERLSQVPGFLERYPSYKRMKNFEESVGIRTWYAFFESHNDVIINSPAYLIPLSRIEKNVPECLKMMDINEESTDTGLFGIPIDCMNTWDSHGIDLSDKCRNCEKKHCEISVK